MYEFCRHQILSPSSGSQPKHDSHQIWHSWWMGVCNPPPARPLPRCVHRVPLSPSFKLHLRSDRQCLLPLMMKASYKANPTHPIKSWHGIGSLGWIVDPWTSSSSIPNQLMIRCTHTCNQRLPRRQILKTERGKKQRESNRPVTL